MKTDDVLKQEVCDELEWDPTFDASAVSVAVTDGIVKLEGHVPSFAQKVALEKAVQRVAGVRAFVVEVAVARPAAEVQDDETVAQAVRAVLEATEGLPRGAITVAVERGCITLTGTLGWGHQRRAAELATARVRGVVGVVNLISVRADADPADIATKILAALKRRAHADAKRLDVEVREGVVTLRGTVGSLAEKRAAEGVAWATRGVRGVVDQLTVG
ncbi:BON domain-containing protein [Trinickia caryophylli]|uniref:Osmotically-inducible protein OsmY, contains BON domain n=1 Tax=Trinickia caryophylli TaxID=28094 RepID=A0A1X7GHJ4_TRICW|nr:BON domain-containing protein [Trinickia caryophylli]PMS10726.1 BON domain-containing protein [Trinickia caryophylli]TRX13900.1 BON domain-containing protein [Trinickia caryophylli]WQE15490.1 BON domain-containing protein [Trinickia caryophylli]SMF69152.1 Osmotically-inducible protein OsmY, contains BON domain [Trinickia caryophylli]GLU33765.1 phospholipid-binding protein [Trinickia caryophylli]